MAPGALTTGRPRASEAAPYYFTYIDKVPGENVTAVLAGQLEECLPFFQGISEAESLHRYAPDKWSIRQTLNHINDAERVFCLRALWFARGFDLPQPSFDQNIAVSVAEVDRIQWAAHVEEFQHVRLATLDFFRHLPPEAWARTGIASDNRFSVRAVAYVIAGHLTHHISILRERYLS